MAVIEASFQKESSDRYLTYALSVVSGRALPDVRDGLKPVQRRILYAMLHNLNLKPTTSHKKCAAVVGDVLAKFHPHGDIACYEALVRMAQDFSLRYPLIDGQGNFGSLDGDGAAAYRYTEARLQAAALEVLGEIHEETVPFRDNFDASTLEPVVLPSRLPNLLINGSSGIAVGMATNIPPHNLRDTVKALLLLLDEPEVAVSKLVTQIKGPDFPTGCQILNSKKELDEIYETGRGQIKMRGQWKTEKEVRGKSQIIITSIPYSVNKSQLVEKIADLIIDKKVPQLVDIRDESTKDVRVVLELKAESDVETVMAFLCKNTPLESNFSVNLTALIPGENNSLIPKLLSLKDCLKEFLTFRHVVVKNRLIFERKNLLERIHILEGFAIIFDALDEAIKIVRKSNGRSDAAEKLRVRFKLTEIQSFAIVDLKIYQLSKTNIDEIKNELAEKEKRVAEIDAILKNPKKISELVKKDLERVAAEFGDARRSEIVKDHVEVEIDQSAFVVKEEVYALITTEGWVKRIRQNNELSATRLREGDVILRAHPLSTIDQVLFVTNLGNIYCLSVNDFPSSSGYGDPIQKHLKFKDGEKVVESFGLLSSDPAGHVNDYQYYIKEGDVVYFITKDGQGFSGKLSEVSNIKRSGKRVMKVRDNDSLVAVVKPANKLSFITKNNYGLTIKGKEVLERNLAAMGVTLIGVRDGDEVRFVVPWDRDREINCELVSGREKAFKLSEIAEGKRSHKGNKLPTNSDISKIKL